MIITLILSEINIDENELICQIKTITLNKYKKLLVKQYVFYRFYWKGRQLTLKCDLLNIHKDIKVVLWPSHKLPFRKYPVHVYLYAIAIYLSEKINMRTAAEKTRKNFNLETFSHSTLSRALKRLSQNLGDLSSVFQTISGTTTSSAPLVKKKHWNDSQSEEYGRLLNVINPVLTGIDEFGAVLGYRYYNMCQKFIL